MILEKGKPYYYAREGKQVRYVRHDQEGYVVVVDDEGEQYHINGDELTHLPKQVDMTIDEIIEREG